MVPRRKIAKSTTDSTNIEQLSEEQVWDVVEFARQMSNVYPQIFTPDLINARMKDVNMNPLQATQDGISKAINNPKDNEVELIGYSEFFEYTDMMYKRMLYYLGNMLSFDLTYVCTNAEYEDYSSEEYKKDLNKLYEFFDRFDVKQEFKKVTRQLVRQETYFSVFRQDSNKFLLQELPEKYCKITGRWDYGILFDFNMMWFISNPGVDIRSYPSVFRKYYKRVMDDKDNGYRNNGKVSGRNGEWVYWVETDPTEDNVWAWKFNPDQAGRVPFLSPLFADLVLKPLIRNLQTNTYIIEASKILIGLIGFNKDSKSGQVKDALNIDPDTAGKFAGLIRQGLAKEIQFGIAPFSDVKAFDFSTSEKNMLENYAKTTSSLSGINSRLIYATDKMTSEETRNSISVDSYLMTYIYPMFNDFLNYHVNKLTSKFKFKFTCEGLEFDMDKSTRLENAMKLADKGIVLPQKFASAMGMLPQDLERQMMMAKTSGFANNLMSMINIYNTTNEGGRPVSDNPTDSTIATRDSGANIERGGKI